MQLAYHESDCTTFATPAQASLLAAGIPVKVVSARLGHSSTVITSDLYTHVIPAVAQDAADQIAALIPMRAAALNRRANDSVSAPLAQPDKPDREEQ